MIDITSDFPHLGARDYIHGTSILAAFLDALDMLGTGTVTVVKRVKFQRPAKTNGRLVLATEALAERDLDAANATLAATIGGTRCRGYFIETGAAVTRRENVSYAISDVRANDFGGTCRIAPQSRDELIRALVEANKRFHELSFGSDEGAVVRFGYLEAWTPPPRDVSFAGTLDAVNLVRTRTGDGWMTINRLVYAPDSGPSSRLTLCFNVAPAKVEA